MLGYAERGLLTLPLMRTEARREYRYDIAGDSFRVFFPDGRFFHEGRLDGATAFVAHDCEPDTYRGRYRILGPDRWSLGWRITGPRKDLVISSIFSRPLDG